MAYLILQKIVKWHRDVEKIRNNLESGKNPNWIFLRLRAGCTQPVIVSNPLGRLKFLYQFFTIGLVPNCQGQGPNTASNYKKINIIEKYFIYVQSFPPLKLRLSDRNQPLRKTIFKFLKMLRYKWRTDSGTLDNKVEFTKNTLNLLLILFLQNDLFLNTIVW